LDLKDLITSIRNYEGITRKNMIKGVTSLLKDSYNITGKTVLGLEMTHPPSTSTTSNYYYWLLMECGVS